MNTPLLYWANVTELLTVIREKTGICARADLPRDRLVHLADTGEIPQKLEHSPTQDSRARLETWVQENFRLLDGQLPCIGPHRGKCRIYGCSESRHLDCLQDMERNQL